MLCRHCIAFPPDVWLNQEKDVELKRELAVLFGRVKDDRGERFGFQDANGVWVSPYASDYFANSKRLCLTAMNPEHTSPSENEQLGMKVLQLALIYSDREDRTSQALLALKQALQLNPFLSEAWYKLGSYHMMNRAPDAAIEALEKCLALSPQFLPAYSDLAASFMVLKNYNKAIHILQRALELNPEHMPTLYNKGVCHQNLEDWHEAVKCYEKIMSLHQRDMKGVEKDGSAAIQLTPVNIPNVVHALAHCYSTLENLSSSMHSSPSLSHALSSSSVKSSSSQISLPSSFPVSDRPRNYYLSKSVQLLSEYLVYPEHHKDERAYCMLGCAEAEMGHFSDAKEAFQSALSINENSLDAHVNMGMMLFAEGRYEQSLSHLEHALQLDDSLYQVHINIAHAYRMKGAFEEAMRHYRNAIQINAAASGEAYLHLAIILFSLHQFETAKPFLDEALKRFPESIEVHYHLALYYKSVAQIANAARTHFDVAYRLTLASMPSSQRICFQLLDDGNYTAFAKAMYRELTDESHRQTSAASSAHTSHGNAPSRTSTSSTSHSPQKFSPSAKSVSDLLTTGTLVQQTSVNAASLLMETGRLSDAMRVYQAIISAAPRYVPAHYNLARAYESVGDYQKASEHLMIAVECEPKLMEAHLQLGNVLSAMGEFERAHKYLKVAVEVNRHSSSAWHSLADCEVELGHYRTAQQSYNQVTRLNPTDSDAHVGIGVCFYHLKRFKDSEAAYSQAIEISGGRNPLAYYNLSSTLFALNKVPEGIEALEKTIELDPSFPHAHLDLATTLVQVATNTAQQHHLQGGSKQHHHHHQQQQQQLHPNTISNLQQLPNIQTISHHLNTALSLDPSLIDRVPQNMKQLITSQ